MRVAWEHVHIHSNQDASKSTNVGVELGLIRYSTMGPGIEIVHA